MFLVSSCSCLRSIHWSQVLSRERRCNWRSADRRCSNYIWVMNNFIAHSGATYIRGFTVIRFESRNPCTRNYCLQFILQNLKTHLYGGIIISIGPDDGRTRLMITPFIGWARTQHEPRLCVLGCKGITAWLCSYPNATVEGISNINLIPQHGKPTNRKQSTQCLANNESELRWS